MDRRSYRFAYYSHCLWRYLGCNKTLGMGMVESFSALLAVRLVLGIGEGRRYPRPLAR